MKTIFGMVDFSADTNSALYALVAAMIGGAHFVASRAGISAFRARNRIR